MNTFDPGEPSPSQLDEANAAVPIEGGINWAAVEAAGGHRPGVVARMTATEMLDVAPSVPATQFVNPASASLAPPVSEEAKMARKAERDLIVKTLGQKYALVQQDVDANPQWSAADASKHLQRGQVYYELINELRGTPVNTQPKR